MAETAGYRSSSGRTRTWNLQSLQSVLARLHDLLEPGGHGRRADLIVDRLIIGLIVLNVAAVIAESFGAVAERYGQILSWIEVGSVTLFTLEYVARLATSRFRYPDKRLSVALLLYIVSPMALVDLAAVLPFYLPLVVRVDLRFLRVLRLTRLFRLFKVSRYTRALQLIGDVLRAKAPELTMTVFVTVLLLLLAASTMYYIETDAQPDAFPNIVAAFWWAVATLTTVGYGDVYPVTGWGKLIAGIIAMLGIGLVALPTGIVSSGFLELVQRREDQQKSQVVRRNLGKGRTSARRRGARARYAIARSRAR